MKFVRANNAGWHDERTHRVLWNLEELPPGETGSVDISLSPGDYVVAAAYGAAVETRAVSLPEGARLMVSFIMKAGGLSIDSRLGETDAAPGSVKPSKHLLVTS
jgi:hypothetical protein